MLLNVVIPPFSTKLQLSSAQPVPLDCWWVVSQLSRFRWIAGGSSLSSASSAGSLVSPPSAQLLPVVTCQSRTRLCACCIYYRFSQRKLTTLIKYKPSPNKETGKCNLKGLGRRLHTPHLYLLNVCAAGHSRLSWGSSTQCPSYHVHTLSLHLLHVSCRKTVVIATKS